jgi:predicted ABC-type transport system involved in lysophospholipase L1 biosynthesis ATPase subunit
VLELLMKVVHGNNVALMMITHEAAFASLCSRCIVLLDGRISSDSDHP